MSCARLFSFIRHGKPGYGFAAPDGVIDLSARFGAHWPTLREAIADGTLPALARAAEAWDADFALEDVCFTIPIPSPEKIICVGVNFPDRNEEYKDGQPAQQNPSLFVRFARSFTGHGQPLIRPRVSAQLDYEGEIALIIGKAGRHIAERDALGHVAGLSLANDGSVRDWVRHAKFNVTQGKNFEGSGAIGPWLVPFEDEAQIADISLRTRVNGECRQEDRSSRMTFGVRKLISYISAFTTLVPGDIILTGTPAGAGARRDPPVWLQPGDIVEVEADGLGILRNGIADET